MSVRRRRISGRRAERLLRDAPSGASTNPDPLARLLAEAAAPSSTRDAAPRGEDAALAAFRRARQVPAPVTPTAPTASTTGSAGRSGLARLLTVKAAVAVFAVTTIGGVALATGTGSLPGQHHRPDRTPTATRGQSPPAATPSRTAGRTVRPAPVPSASSEGLCRAYERNRRNGKAGEALDGPAFAKLIKAAGSEKKVARYCAALLQPPPKKRLEPTPKGKADKPTARPRPPPRAGRLALDGDGSKPVRPQAAPFPRCT
ncbi:hypothetical protein [Actinomadura sp. HBU206391]|uniref:hypothetical protein n=1 Tax=Actinomadura sp. HBU206391 TaxID=2731692 RepID=UPI00164F78D8|nr:hypothetical protein [Actinomadura sp. HBU206391]MBC6457925.1 hypothetical protein [Actinomadura sp. HBU206391]